MGQRVEIKNPVGVNKALAPSDLPLSVWSDTINTRFRNGKATKTEGYYNYPTVPTGSALPQFFLTLTESGVNYFYYANSLNIFRTDGVNPPVTYTRASGTYNGEAFFPTWTGTNLNTTLVFNNTIDPPQSRIFGQTRFVDLPNWPSGLKAKVIRSYKNFLIALNTTNGTTNYPTTVRWSSAADPGQVPASWSLTDPTNDAGENYLADTNGVIVDGANLRDSFIIYKDDSVYSMSYVGGTYVFSFRQLFDDQGILSKHCVAEFDGNHFVVGADDIYVHNGVQKRSVIDGVLKEWFYGQLAPSDIGRTFVAANYETKEMWVCYKERKDNGSIVGPTRAIVWNWIDNTWSIRSIPYSDYAGSVRVTNTSAITWENTFRSWDQFDATWEQGGFSTSKNQLVFVGAVGGASVMDSSLPSPDSSILERVGLDIDDDEGIKIVSSITPHLFGSGTCQITLGTQTVEGGPVTWRNPVSYAIGSQYKLDCRLVGRYVCIRFQFPRESIWELNGYTIEFEKSTGRR